MLDALAVLPVRLPPSSVLPLATVKPLSDADRIEDAAESWRRSIEFPDRSGGTTLELPLGCRHAVELVLPLLPLRPVACFSATGVSHGCSASTSCRAGKPPLSSIETHPPENSSRVSTVPDLLPGTSVISNALITVPAARLPFFLEPTSRD